MIDIKSVVENNLCVGCGMCVSEGKDAKMKWDKNGFLVPDLNSVFNENAVKVCPFNPNPEENVKDEDTLSELFLPEASLINNQVGRYLNTYVGYSKEFRNNASSGGIATYVFQQLFKLKVVDYLYIVKEKNGTYEYQLFQSFNEIYSISKTRYIPVTLYELFKQIDGINGKIAISGVACFIKAIRLKQYYNKNLREKIPFLVGIICGGLKSRFFTDFLTQASGLYDDNYKNQDYRIKDAESSSIDYSYGVFDKSDNFYSVKMPSLGDMWGSGLFKNNACDFCTDVTTELADISLGDAWIDPYRKDGLGNSIIITRSLLADSIIRSGIDLSNLVVDTLPLEEFIKSQESSFKHRQNAINYRRNLITKDNKGECRIQPYIRKKFIKNTIPIEFKVVQKYRMKIRRESLEYWRATKDYKEFNLLINDGRKELSTKTRFYHRIQRLRKMFKLRTL